MTKPRITRSNKIAGFLGALCGLVLTLMTFSVAAHGGPPGHAPRPVEVAAQVMR